MASRGTVVTRAASPLGFATVSDVRQALALRTDGALSTFNTATLRTPVGDVKLCADGTWRPVSASPCDGDVSFSSFGANALNVAVPSWFGPPRVARFRTLYLDDVLRVAEGATSGNRFVFRRDAL